MKLFVNNLDLSELVERVVWSGDTRQVARKLEFTIVSKATDYYLPKPKLTAGDPVILKDDAGAVVFGGILFDIDKSGAANTTSYLAFDFLFYINNSEINRIFDNTAETITAEVCKELGVNFGGAAPTGIKVYMPCLNKNGYEAIMMAYTYAGRANGKKYIPIMKDIDKLWVIEKGSLCDVVLNGDYNLIDANYKISLQNLVNKVLIVDKTGKVVGKIQDSESTGKYGTIQKVYTQEDGKDAKAAAQAMLQSIERSSSVSGISDIRAKSGYALVIEEPITGLLGKFYIESDTHTFENGSSTMELSLAFENIMDEKEIENEEE